MSGEWAAGVRQTWQQHRVDAVVLVTMKGESEGGLYRNPHEPDHAIPPPYRERTVVIRPASQATRPETTW